VRLIYFASLRLAARSAAAPADRSEDDKYEAASVLTTVTSTSQVKGLPSRPTGFFVTGIMLAVVIPPTSRQSKSPAVTWSFLIDLNHWVSPLIPTSGSTTTPITSRACNYHTRALRHVHSLLTDEVAQTVKRSIVAYRLYYCNALLHGAPAATIVKLQQAQNNLARVVCQRSGRTDAAPLLRSLHWLPVKHRITYTRPRC